MDWIFDNNKILKNDQQVTTYCKLHLCVATHCFNQLVDQIAANKGGFTYSNIRKYRNIIYDYLHDLREIVEHLEKKTDPSYSFFSGGKYYGTRTIETFRISNNLFWTSALQENFIDHRLGQNLSTFSLRQCLELKFRRIVGVGAIFHKTTFQHPKLRHDFFFTFITSNSGLFNFYTKNIREIWKIYSWTNLCIHLGILPRVWMLQYALELVAPLIIPQPADKKGRWHLHSSVEIHDLNELRERFKKHFHNNFSESEWELELVKPEATILNKP